MSRNKHKTQGHPARVARDPLSIEIEKLATRAVKLFPTVLRDPRFDPDDAVISKAAAVGLLHLLAILEEKPTPFEIYGMEKRK